MKYLVSVVLLIAAPLAHARTWDEILAEPLPSQPVIINQINIGATSDTSLPIGFPNSLQTTTEYKVIVTEILGQKVITIENVKHGFEVYK